MTAAKLQQRSPRSAGSARRGTECGRGVAIALPAVPVWSWNISDSLLAGGVTPYCVRRSTLTSEGDHNSVSWRGVPSPADPGGPDRSLRFELTGGTWATGRTPGARSAQTDVDERSERIAGADDRQRSALIRHTSA